MKRVMIGVGMILAGFFMIWHASTYGGYANIKVPAGFILILAGILVTAIMGALANRR